MGKTTLCRITKDGKPMMSDKEIEIISRLVEIGKYERCLEWGSGNSTIYFSHKHGCIKSWIAIEHNGHCIEPLKNKIKDNTYIVWETEKNDYVGVGKWGRFDFILIDGEYRKQCLEIALKIINKDGVILLHDSGREEYQDFIKEYGGEELCEGEHPINGFYAHRGLTLFKKTQ